MMAGTSGALGNDLILERSKLINKAVTNKATFEILMAIKQGNSFVPDLHALLMQENKEYRYGYENAIAFATNQGMNPHM